MHRRPLLARLARYAPCDEADRRGLERLTRFVKAHPDCFERSLRAGHVTASAWVVHPVEDKVLLTHHRKLGIWVQLGGHCDGDPDTLGAALREAREESGIEEIEPVSEAIFDLDVHPIPARGNVPVHLHYDVRYALRAGRADFRTSDESHALAWVPLAELGRYTVERSMWRMRRKWDALARA